MPSDLDGEWSWLVIIATNASTKTGLHFICAGNNVCTKGKEYRIVTLCVPSGNYAPPTNKSYTYRCVRLWPSRACPTTTESQTNPHLHCASPLIPPEKVSFSPPNKGEDIKTVRSCTPPIEWPRPIKHLSTRNVPLRPFRVMHNRRGSFDPQPFRCLGHLAAESGIAGILVVRR